MSRKGDQGFNRNKMFDLMAEPQDRRVEDVDHRLTTASGRTIRTAGNHPYLVRRAPLSREQRASLARERAFQVWRRSVDAAARADFRHENFVAQPIEDDTIIADPKAVDFAALTLNRVQSRSQNGGDHQSRDSTGACR